MSVIKYSRPGYGILDVIQNELQGLLLDDAKSIVRKKWSPDIDIKAKNDKYLIAMDIPGVNPKDIKISIDDNAVTIEGERNSEHTDSKDGAYHLERFSGSFFRQFTLPEHLSDEGTEAVYENGVLKLSIPKKNKKSTKLIEVKTKS